MANLEDYAAHVSEIERHTRPKKAVAPRHIPQEIVPVPIDEVRELVRSAVSRTSLTDPVVPVLAGWAFFEPHLRFTVVDASHTRIELDLAGSRGAEVLLFVQRRAEVDRFFVAIHDELDRRARR
jgi:hypothetical protein